MRVIFIGCVESSEHMLKSAISVPEVELVGVATRTASSYNSDFCSLQPLADQHSIPCYLVDGNDQDEMASWIRERNPDVGFCFGWSYLLNAEVLSIPRLGFLGYHPTKLPRNRGRHPIIWTLVLGLGETASTFFFMDEGADTGDILSQRSVPVTHEDNARSLYDRLMQVADNQIQTFAPQLAANQFSRTPQDDAKANTWRKRTKTDGEIDWRMSASSIYDLIRALTHPYPGAHCIANSQEVKVWESQIVSEQFDDIDHLEPGKVLESTKERVCVKCGSGVLALTVHDFKDLPDVNTYLR